MKTEINSANKIGLETSVVQTEGMPSAKIGDEIAFMSIENGKYYGLDSIGSKIWSIMEKPVTVIEIVDDLITEYDVERKTCEDNVLELLRRLFEEGLICTV